MIIKRQLITNLFSIVVVMAAVTALFIVVYSAVLKEQRRFSDVVFLEQGLGTRAEELVRAYNGYRNAPTVERLATYNDAHTALQADMTSLNQLSYTGSVRSADASMRSIMNALVKATDTGVVAAGSGDVTTAGQEYDEANKILQYLPDSVSALLLEELQTSRGMLAQLQQRQQYAFAVGIALLIVVIFAASYVAIRTARSIATPLEQLGSITTRIAQGSFDVRVDPHLKKRDDEISVLATAFDDMTTRLSETIKGLKNATDEASRARDALAAQNDQLAKLNALFISREERIGQLKAELRAAGKAVSSNEGDEAAINVGKQTPGSMMPPVQQ